MNRRSQARKFINDSIQRGVRVRVCDVLVKFPDVASTTTVYRWLHEAKRPTNLSHEPQAYIWHVLDNDPQATPPPKSVRYFVGNGLNALGLQRTSALADKFICFYRHRQITTVLQINGTGLAFDLDILN